MVSNMQQRRLKLFDGTWHYNATHKGLGLLTARIARALPVLRLRSCLAQGVPNAVVNLSKRSLAARALVESEVLRPCFRSPKVQLLQHQPKAARQQSIAFLK